MRALLMTDTLISLFVDLMQIVSRLRRGLHDAISTLSDAFRAMGAKMAPNIAKRRPATRQEEPREAPRGPR